MKVARDEIHQMLKQECGEFLRGLPAVRDRVYDRAYSQVPTDLPIAAPERSNLLGPIRSQLMMSAARSHADSTGVMYEFDTAPGGYVSTEFQSRNFRIILRRPDYYLWYPKRISQKLKSYRSKIECWFPLISVPDKLLVEIEHCENSMVAYFLRAWKDEYCESMDLQSLAIDKIEGAAIGIEATIEKPIFEIIKRSLDKQDKE